MPKHYDRKVIHTPTARMLALSRIIPKDWGYVRIWEAEKSDKVITIMIEKLMSVKELAPAESIDKINK